MQVQHNEASLDTKAVFSLLSTDVRYGRFMLDIQHTDIKSTLISAMDIVCNPNTTSKLSSQIRFIITLFQQWLIRLLCKKAMQLLTPEALVLHHKCIPSSYIENYLRHQAHFSLKELVALFNAIKASSQRYDCLLAHTSTFCCDLIYSSISL